MSTTTSTGGAADPYAATEADTSQGKVFTVTGTPRPTASSG
jgi:hypothetical protein